MPYTESDWNNASRYENPDLEAGLEKLSEFSRERAKIAELAANYIIENGRETLDLPLYYTAMFGRSYSEGFSEQDQNWWVPLEIARLLTLPGQQGQPVIIRSPNYPESNFDVGVLSSFSEEDFTPVKFKIYKDPEHPPESRYWKGHMIIALREVLPTTEAGKLDYKLADHISEIPICDTATWISGPHGPETLEVHPKGTGGVEVGEKAMENSGDKGAIWLRDRLAPMERKELTREFKDYQERSRTRRRQHATEAGVSEAKYSAQGLSPTIEGFFDLLTPYAEANRPIDVKAVFQEWTDPYDAQSLLAELEIRDLVEVDDIRQVVVSALGRAVIKERQKGLY